MKDRVPQIGWIGWINDPNLDGRFDIDKDLHVVRKLLIDLAGMSLLLATAALDIIAPQHIQDAISCSWSAIGIWLFWSTK